MQSFTSKELDDILNGQQTKLTYRVQWDFGQTEHDVRELIIHLSDFHKKLLNDLSEIKNAVNETQHDVSGNSDGRFSISYYDAKGWRCYHRLEITSPSLLKIKKWFTQADTAMNFIISNYGIAVAHKACFIAGREFHLPLSEYAMKHFDCSLGDGTNSSEMYWRAKK